jgi:hypothetical protein
MRSTSRPTTSPFSHTPSAPVVWSGPPAWGGPEARVICGPGAGGHAVAEVDDPDLGVEPLAEELARAAALLLKAQLDQPPSALHPARSDRLVHEALVSLQRVESLVQELTTDATPVVDRPPEDRFSDVGGRGEWVAAGLGH